MLDAAALWFADHHPLWTVLGAEHPVSASLPLPAPADAGDAADAGEAAEAAEAGEARQRPRRPIELAGRVDWLSADAAGRPVVVDFKTSSSVQSKADAVSNAQLASYQVAVGTDEIETGGAQLVYLRKGKPETRDQPPLSSEQRQVWIGTIRSVAERLANGTLDATANASCDVCAVRTCCPLQPDGRQVIG